MTDRGHIQFPVFQVVALSNDVSAGNFPKLIRPLDTSEFYKILKRISIGSPCLRIVDIGESLDHQRNIGHGMEIVCAQKPA